MLNALKSGGKCGGSVGFVMAVGLMVGSVLRVGRWESGFRLRQRLHTPFQQFRWPPLDPNSPRCMQMDEEGDLAHQFEALELY